MRALRPFSQLAKLTLDYNDFEICEVPKVLAHPVIQKLSQLDFAGLSHAQRERRASLRSLHTLTPHETTRRNDDPVERLISNFPRHSILFEIARDTSLLLSTRLEALQRIPPIFLQCQYSDLPGPEGIRTALQNRKKHTGALRTAPHNAPNPPKGTTPLEYSHILAHVLLGKR